MTNPSILGPLSDLYEMQTLLLESVPPEDAARQFHPAIGSLNWLLGRGVYQELYWLREVLMGDNDLSHRVEPLFRPGALPLTEQCDQLPPRDHLLNWAAEIHDEHLMRLANPARLPRHALLENDRLQWFLLQEQAKRYETMLVCLNQRSLLQADPNYRVTSLLKAQAPAWKTKELSSGHYRIGARNDPRAYDNELPPQAVELSSFRIALEPVSNAQYLAFMQADAYNRTDLWTEAGLSWKNTQAINHPEYWRQDDQHNWYLIGINGPTDLPPDEPVAGINQHEAQAFANWVDSRQGEFQGAALQHEYQWEMAARTGVIPSNGRAWEWCSNHFHPYPEFVPFPDQTTSASDFDITVSLRGGSLHTHRVLRRASLRQRAAADQRCQHSGLRLVFPPRFKWS